MAILVLLLLWGMGEAAFGKGLYDLPIVPVKFGDPAPIASRTTPPPPGPIEEDEPIVLDPPPTFYGEELASSGDSVVYVLDFSSSMGQIGQPNQRYHKVVRELKRSLRSLPSNYWFSAVAYGCTVQPWQNTLVPATDAWKGNAAAWADTLRPEDKTATGPATKLALGLKPAMVVLLTDGAPNCGAGGVEGHRRMIREANGHGAVINVFGVQATGQWRSFCQSVASDSGGGYFDVP